MLVSIEPKLVALAVEYVLMHRHTFFEPRMGGGFRDGAMGAGEHSWQSKPVQKGEWVA